ncbi:cell wall-active antibiotics response protein LiaF [Indiicoccus explosivorum]|uniref:cell wall-active antibiotics response protein LiaF n=1 Tax=Indiicoccus explosivorum TaxID=1917864 RepID=UPI001F4D8FD8|nr:cell wall-active antibiotics response protein LiaF [Indiicoccus explosivorum]
MLRQFTTNQQVFFLLLIFVLLFVESTFFHNGTVFLAVLGFIFMYIGTRNYHRFGKALFWLGVLFLAAAILSLWTLRFVVLVTALVLMVRLWRGENSQQEVPLMGGSEPKADGRGLIRNKLFSAQSTPAEAYEWKDIHVQGLAGDLRIDVTRTVLPKRTSLISIRQGFGKVRIIVPYEVPVRVFYSTLYGDARLFSNPKQRILYSTVQAHDGYSQEEASQRELIISLTTWMGDVEVIRQ